MFKDFVTFNTTICLMENQAFFDYLSNNPNKSRTSQTPFCGGHAPKKRNYVRLYLPGKQIVPRIKTLLQLP